MGKICESCGEEMDVSEYQNNICYGCIALELEYFKEEAPIDS